MPFPGWSLTPVSARWLSPSHVGTRAVYAQRTPCVHTGSCQQCQLQLGGPQVILCAKWLEQAVPALKQEERKNSASGNDIYFHEFGVTT